MELNEFLQPVNAPVSRDRGFVNALQSQYTLQGIGAAKITQGAFATKIDVGVAGNAAFVRLDGVNNRIIINDGTTTRIIIGSV